MKNGQQFDFSALMKMLGSKGASSNQQRADELMKGLDESQSRQLNEILGDKSKIDALLNSPAAQKIIESINRDKNGQHQ